MDIKIKTRDFGEVEVLKESIITFDNGLFAFENLKKFVLLSPLGKETFPMWLQSVESEKPCFIVYDPTQVVEGYKPEITESDKQSVDFEEGNELCLLSIAVIPEDYKKTTINLKSPIIINKTKSKAAQIILEQDYEIKHPIFTGKGDE